MLKLRVRCAHRLASSTALCLLRTMPPGAMPCTHKHKNARPNAVTLFCWRQAARLLFNKSQRLHKLCFMFIRRVRTTGKDQSARPSPTYGQFAACARSTHLCAAANAIAHICAVVTQTSTHTRPRALVFVCVCVDVPHQRMHNRMQIVCMRAHPFCCSPLRYQMSLIVNHAHVPTPTNRAGNHHRTRHANTLTRPFNYNHDKVAETMGETTNDAAVWRTKSALASLRATTATAA